MPQDPETRTELAEEVRALRQEVIRLNAQRYFRIESTLWQVAFWNLVRGLAWGVGSVIGATLLISYFVQVLSSIDFIPVLGEWAQQIINQIDTAPPE